MKPDPMATKPSPPGRVSPVRRLLGPEPWLVPLVIVVCGLGTLALSGGGLWPLPLAVLAVVLARAWLWGHVCAEGRAGDAGEGRS